MDRLTKRVEDGRAWYNHAPEKSVTNDDLLDCLAAYEDTGLTPEEIMDYVGDVAIQFGYKVKYNGRAYISTGGLSTLEWTFDILGWDEPHSYPEGECQWEGCHEFATCGTPTKNGYMLVCSKHSRVIQAREEAEKVLEGMNNV